MTQKNFLIYYRISDRGDQREERVEGGHEDNIPTGRQPASG